MKAPAGLLVLMLAGHAAADNEAPAQPPASAAAPAAEPAAPAAEPAAPAPEKTDAAPVPHGKTKVDTRSGGKYSVQIRTRLSRDALPPYVGRVCMLPGPMPEEVKYMEIGQMTSRKGTYGGVDEVREAMADEARRLGGDAVAELQTGHKGSMMPWRYSVPTGKGKLVKMTGDPKTFDCVRAGGQLE